MIHTRPFTIAAVAFGALALGAASVRAQAVRIHSTTEARYVQLRPIQYDSASGTYLTLPLTYAAPLTEDVEISAWGFGVTGLRAYALLRGRAALGSGLIWPRYGDHFDALAAFLELERPQYRIRAGRQQRASALGWYAFDGLLGTWRPLPVIRVEAYGGRGLARGFLEPANSPALTSLDPLRPDRGTILLGASAWAAPTARTSFSAIYQRELLSDRSGVVSERAAFDARVGLGSWLVLSGSADADLARQQWGKASASAMLRLSRASFVEFEAFQYRPTLDLTTIWGVFAPESNHGVTASGRLAPWRAVALSASFTYRQFEPLSAGQPFLTNIGDDTKTFTVGLATHCGALAFDGSYHLQVGYGGKQSGGDLALALAHEDGWRVGLRGAAFQQTEMFRVADGTVFGFGGEVRSPVGRTLGIRADVMRYLHRKLNGQNGIDWNQTRASLAFDWTFGANADRTGGYR
jgi:hypothetical protein